MHHAAPVRHRQCAADLLDQPAKQLGRQWAVVQQVVQVAAAQPAHVVAAAELLKEHGAADVYAACTHAVFSGPAVDRLKNSAITKVVATNTAPLPPEKQFDKLEVLSVAGIIADAIDAVFEDTSVSEIFGGANQS